MSTDLPPLGSLRAFEAAARHLSFAKAADELAVTPAAISHQIKGLEEWLGLPLFVRGNRKVTLSEAGRACLPGVRDGFDRLRQAVGQARALTASQILTVTTAPGLAAQWLVPRLEGFQRLHPEIDVRISANFEVVDLRSGRADIGVRYGAGLYPGLKVYRMFGDAVVPVCAPALAASLKVPADLAACRLLHDDSARFDPTQPDWRMWLKAVGTSHPETERGLHFSHAEHAIAAAEQGLGVLLSRRRLVAPAVAAGRLVIPFAVDMPTRLAYWLVHPEGAERQPKVAAFRDWLLAEAAGEPE